MKISSYRQLIRWGGGWDLGLTLPFALPGLAEAALTGLTQLHHSAGFAGTIPLFHPLHLLFVHLFGLIVSLWSLVRLVRPEPWQGLADAAGRLGFAGAMILAWSQGATGVVWLFAGSEILWAAAQVGGYFASRLLQTRRV